MKNKTLIIAEAGVNHNGNINLALKQVDIASKSRADYVKFLKSLTRENLSLPTSLRAAQSL